MLQFEVGTDGLGIDNNFTILFITYVLELSLNFNFIVTLTFFFFSILIFLNLFACDFVLITLNFQMICGESK